VITMPNTVIWFDGVPVSAANPLPTTATIGDVTVEDVTIGAGSSIIGKVGIDQTTPGTTNKVVASIASSGVASGAIASGAVAAGAIVDGADVTQGAKADNRSAATDTTAVSVMSVLKEISYMEQNPATRAVTGTFYQSTQPVSIASAQVASGAIASGAVASGAVASGAFASGSIALGAVVDGAMVTIGAKADDKSTATDTTAVSLMSVLKEISYMLQNPASRAVTNAGTFAVQDTPALISGYGQAKLDHADVTTAQTLVAAVADKKFYITSIILSVTTAGTYWIEDDDAAQITCKFTLGANGGCSHLFPINSPFKSTTVNKGLKVKGSAAGVIGCMITYYTLA
jgi:hypothetical protein